MRSTNHQPKYGVAHRSLLRLSILTLSLMCASVSISLAQSGRQQTQTPPEPTPTRSPQSGRDDKKDQAPAFIVVTNVPDRFQDIYPQAGYPQPANLEYQARAGCLLELRSIPSAKVVEDEDVVRWEAKETALGEDKAWVIWMELRWDKTSSAYDSTPFRLRYLLFEPRTGRIAASGVGNGVRQTWGKPQSRSISLEELAREAGRDIAHQVMSELRRDK